MRKYKIFFLFSFFFFLFSFLFSLAYANNISVTNVSITAQSTANQTANVQFDITWANSWCNAINWDAAWVFVKYSTDSGTTWAHATLKASGGTPTSSGNGIINPTGFSQGAGTGLNIIVPTEATSGKKGAFLQRSANGVGTVTTTGVQLVWDWSQAKLSSDGVTPVTATTAARVKVFAIEMVYIPQGAFSAGDNATSVGSFKAGPSNPGPWNIQNANAISVTNNGSYGFYYVSAGNSGESATGSAFTINTTFPSGYNAFYCMKYDISQGQYRNFLNTLTRTQQATRISVNISGTSVTNCFMDDNVTSGGTHSSPLNRNGIRCATTIPASPTPVTFGCDLNNNGTFNEASDGEWIACNHLSWMDLAAYVAWAGLRPMTELEFEKACRGPNTPVSGEYAWGTTDLIQVTTANITNSGYNSEGTSQTGNGLCVENSGTSGPLRCGFSATSSTTRLGASSSYYGVMDLSGGLWKRPVTVGNSTGLGFSGTNGTGVLSTNGNATNSDWPGCTSGEVTGATGAGFRGGGWSVGATYARTSDRSSAAYTFASRYSDFGGRCVRTSP